jgi:hypothetical protein
MKLMRRPRAVASAVSVASLIVGWVVCEPSASGPVRRADVQVPIQRAPREAALEHTGVSSVRLSQSLSQLTTTALSSSVQADSPADPAVTRQG